jgi:hypothetical protein
MAEGTKPVQSMTVALKAVVAVALLKNLSKDVETSELKHVAHVEIWILCKFNNVQRRGGHGALRGSVGG